MAEPTSRPAKWLWPLIIALLAVLLLIWLFNPAGDEDTGQVEDPIVTGDMAEPAAPDAGSLELAEPIPAEQAPEPVAPPPDPMPEE